MARDEARTVRREDLYGREDLRDDLHDEGGGIPPEKISGRKHPERPLQEGISPEVISGG